ncbi:hypothetical protein [Spongiimicrobium sp. 3-5]|uniref:hypothetical protein n=1 Tax=Spongiimicrobium sp. 3-5 TaxID=3332596 RepID=UPI0039810706
MNKKIDLLYIILLTGLCWSLLIVGHELLGHGGAVLIVGGTPISVDAMYFDQDISGVTFWQEKFVRANGSFINIIFAIIAAFWISRLRNKSTWLGYLLWLIIMMNCFQAGNYIAFGKFISPGMDWAMILNDLEPALLWGILEMCLGVSLIVFGFYYGRKYHYHFLDSKSSHIKQRFKIFGIPVLTATLISVSAALIMPTDDRLLMIWGGVGNSLFFLTGMLVLVFIPSSKEKIKEVSSFEGNRRLLIASVILMGFYLFVMSPGITF